MSVWPRRAGFVVQVVELRGEAACAGAGPLRLVHLAGEGHTCPTEVRAACSAELVCCEGRRLAGAQMTGGERSIVTAAMRATRLCFVRRRCALSYFQQPVGPTTPITYARRHARARTAGTGATSRSSGRSRTGDITSTTGCELGQLVTTEGTTTHTCSATATAPRPASTPRSRSTRRCRPSRRDRGAWPRLERLVQPRGRRLVHGDGRRLRARLPAPAGAYGGPDSGAASVQGRARTEPVNSSSGSFGLKYDSSAPPATVSGRGPDRDPAGTTAPLSVTFAQAPGDLSGPGSCRAPVKYSGPTRRRRRSAAPARTGPGTRAPRVALAFKYDATPPQATARRAAPPTQERLVQRAAHNRVHAGPGDVSGQSGCSPAASYNGPDAASVSRSGTCTDGAGNRSAMRRSPSRTTQRTGPADRDPARAPPNATGWYRSSLGVWFASTERPVRDRDAATRPPTGPDSATAAVTWHLHRPGGEREPSRYARLQVRRDRAGDQRHAEPGAQRERVVQRAARDLVRAGPGDVSGTGSCTAATTYGGPDAASASAPGTAPTAPATRAPPASFGFKYDASAPAPTGGDSGAGPGRKRLVQPLARHRFAASDVGPSGIEACSSQTYTGPDSRDSLRRRARVPTTQATQAQRRPWASSTTIPRRWRRLREPAGECDGLAQRAVRPLLRSRPRGTSRAPDVQRPRSVLGPDAASASRSGTSTDAAGNTERTGHVHVRLRREPAVPPGRDARAGRT